MASISEVTDDLAMAWASLYENEVINIVNQS